MIEKEKLGASLEKLWTEAGYASLGELQRKTGISTATWSRIKYGEQIPSPETLEKLGKAIRISHCELLKLSGYITDASCYRRDGGNAILSPTEKTLIAKYRQLDERGQDVVLAVLDNQYLQTQPAFSQKNIL